MRVGDLVASLAALGLGDHDPAVAQAGQVVGHVRAGQPQLAREHGGVARAVEQGHQDPGTRRVGHGPAEPVHDVETRSNGQHALNYTAAADLMPSCRGGGGPELSRLQLRRRGS